MSAIDVLRLRARAQRGERLTEAETAYLESVAEDQADDRERGWRS